MDETVTTRSDQETINVARSFAAHLQRGDVVALYGDLGTGKTRFVKGVCEAFAVREHVTSPTFVLLNRYQGKDSSGEELLIYHLDLYRVNSVEEIHDLGFDEFAYGDGICLVEWAELLKEALPEKKIDVRLTFGEDENTRQIEIARVNAPIIHSPGSVNAGASPRSAAPV